MIHTSLKQIPLHLVCQVLKSMIYDMLYSIYSCISYISRHHSQLLIYDTITGVSNVNVFTNIHIIYYYILLHILIYYTLYYIIIYYITYVISLRIYLLYDTDRASRITKCVPSLRTVSKS